MAGCSVGSNRRTDGFSDVDRCGNRKPRAQRSAPLFLAQRIHRHQFQRLALMQIRGHVLLLRLQERCGHEPTSLGRPFVTSDDFQIFVTRPLFISTAFTIDGNYNKNLL